MPHDPLGFAAIADYLFSLKAQGPKFGIDRMRVLAAALGHPERRVPCIHVAGTNGKGSVSAMLDSILRTAGWRVGLYTSPHLVHLGERVQVDRQRLTDAEIMAYVEELRPVAQRIEATHAGLQPSFFEWMTAMAFLQFMRRRCDIAVLEVGLGGRLDATNVVRPEVSVITSIGLDHCEYLGNEIAQIAKEKAGIIKAGVPVVVGRMPREAETIIRAAAAEVGAPVVAVSDRFWSHDADLPVTNLEGEYQRWNAATATLAAQALAPRWHLTPTMIRDGLAAVHWPGRWQRLRLGGRLVVLDASHNPEGAETLDQNLAHLIGETGRRPIVVTGVLGTARAEPLLRTICQHAAAVHLVIPQQPRACGYDELEALIPRDFGGPVVRDTVARIFPSHGQCVLGGTDDVVVLTGSIYLLGEVMARLETNSEFGRAEA